MEQYAETMLEYLKDILRRARTTKTDYIKIKKLVREIEKMSDKKYMSNLQLQRHIDYEKRRMNTAKLRIQACEDEFKRRESPIAQAEEKNPGGAR